MRWSWRPPLCDTTSERAESFHGDTVVNHPAPARTCLFGAIGAHMLAAVARMSGSDMRVTCGEVGPGCRFAHPGYSNANWGRLFMGTAMRNLTKTTVSILLLALLPAMAGAAE